MTHIFPKDPNLLLSIINMKLRDFYDDFESLCDDLGYDADEINRILFELGYHYVPESNQFKPI